MTDGEKYEKLSNAIKDILCQKLDDLCWLDIYQKLAHLVNIKWNPELLPKKEFLGNCEYYYDCLASNNPYKTPKKEFQCYYCHKPVDMDDYPLIFDTIVCMDRYSQENY